MKLGRQKAGTRQRLLTLHCRPRRVNGAIASACTRAAPAADSIVQCAHVVELREFDQLLPIQVLMERTSSLPGLAGRTETSALYRSIGVVVKIRAAAAQFADDLQDAGCYGVMQA
jgi:hypothetical protein